MTHTQHLFTMVWAGCKEGKCSTQYPDDGLVTIPRPEEQERERSIINLKNQLMNNLYLIQVEFDQNGFD